MQVCGCSQIESHSSAIHYSSSIHIRLQISFYESGPRYGGQTDALQNDCRYYVSGSMPACSVFCALCTVDYHCRKERQQQKGASVFAYGSARLYAFKTSIMDMRLLLIFGAYHRPLICRRDEEWRKLDERSLHSWRRSSSSQIVNLVIDESDSFYQQFDDFGFSDSFDKHHFVPFRCLTPTNPQLGRKGKDTGQLRIKRRTLFEWSERQKSSSTPFPFAREHVNSFLYLKSLRDPRR